MSRKSRMQAQGEEDSEHPWFSGSNVFSYLIGRRLKCCIFTAMDVTV